MKLKINDVGKDMEYSQGNLLPVSEPVDNSHLEFRLFWVSSTRHCILNSFLLYN